MFTQGESVYVCRTTGGWSDAVVQGVDPVAQEVVVMFRDEKGRAMRKALTYAAAAVHLRRKDGGAGGGGVPGQDNSAPFPRADTASPLDLLPPQKRHAVVRLCDAMLAAPQQDTAATARQWLAEDVRDEATFTNVGVKRLGGFYEMVESLASHLMALCEEGCGTADASPATVIRDWAIERAPLKLTLPSGPPPEPPSTSIEANSMPIEESTPIADPTPTTTPTHIAAASAAEGSPDTAPATPPERPASATTPLQDVAATLSSMAALFEEMADVKAEVHQLSQIGSPSDDDIAARDDAAAHYDTRKEAALALAASLPAEVEVPSALEEAFHTALCNMAEEGDERVHSADLVEVLLTKTRTPERSYADVIHCDALLLNACTDGNVAFFTSFLQHLFVAGGAEELDVIEVVSSASFSQTARIPLVLTALSVIPEARITEVAEDLRPVLEEFLFLVTNPTRLLAKESKAALYDCIEAVLASTVSVDTENAEFGGADVTSLLGRVCVTGDLAVLDLLSKYRPNQLHPSTESEDGTSPLIQAVLKGHTEVLRRVVALNTCSVDAKAKLGTALGFAQSLHKTEAEEILLKHGAELSLFNM